MNQKRETPDEFDFDFGNIFGVAPAPGTAAVNDSTKPEAPAGTGREQPQEPAAPAALSPDQKGKSLFDPTITADEVRLAVAGGADVNEKGGIDGQTPLHFAHTAEMTKVLLQCGADPNATDESERTPLYYAESAEQTKALLTAGADATWSDNQGYTALHQARGGEQTRALLEAGADPNATGQNFEGCEVAPLDYASGEKAEALLAAGADPITPMMKAEQKTEQTDRLFDPDITADQVRDAVAHGADVNAWRQEGKVWFERAPDGCDCARRDEVRPLHTAKDPGAARALAEAGADLNTSARTIDADGNDERVLDRASPLQGADAPKTRALLECGAKVPNELRNDTRVVLVQASIAAEKAAHAVHQSEGHDIGPRRGRRV